MNGYKVTRKEFEQKVSYEARYRINNVVLNFGVNEYAEKVDWCDDYDIHNRSDALKILRQFIWTQHKHFGTTYDIEDFSVDSIGWYKEVK